jgi:signal transduction histidine kinase
MSTAAPVMANELERLKELTDFDLDYSGLQESLKDLAKLAARVAGTSVSLVNLIDTFTQWTVSNFGLELDQMPREDSVCQYTIVAKEGQFEVPDLSSDVRFSDKSYVVDEPRLRYYFGVPLVTANGYNLGALCVLDKVGKEITPEKAELLKIIADEIVTRLTAMKVIHNLREKVKESSDAQRKVAHDIRGPLGGIIGIAQIISEQGNENKMEDVLELISLIQKSGSSLLELANEILTSNGKPAPADVELKPQETNLGIFKSKLEKLYAPQARHKQIDFSVTIAEGGENIPFSKAKLLQIAGNLISNAMKFTPQHGKISVSLSLTKAKLQQILTIKVSDNGVGMDEAAMKRVISGDSVSTGGTAGEQGFGFGLALVKHLTDSAGGTVEVDSTPGAGATFTVKIPQKRA